MFLIFTLDSSQLTAQYSPYLDANHSLSLPNGKRLVFNPDMSDEFSTNTSNSKPNSTKWTLSDPPNTSGWKGRFPGHFDADAVSVWGGRLRIVASVKQKNLKDYDGVWKNYTHQGGMVTSVNKGSYGYYETRVKANKTFMSTTFWLISDECAKSGRGTELDILETVGVATKDQNGNTQPWMENFTKRMNSNTHAFGCPGRINNTEQKVGAYLNAARTAKTSNKYHVYGALWLNKNKVIFYLDGKKIGEVVPPSDFDLEMHLKMAVETYDWNQPDSGNDGMGNSKWQRTTIYDYVRSWKLEDIPTNAAGHFDGTDGLYTITARNTGKNINTKNFGVSIATPDVNELDQQWEIKRVSGTPAYTIKSKSTGRYMEVSYARCNPGSNHPLGTWTGNSQAHQRWTIDQLGNNILRLRPYHCSTKALTSWYNNPSFIIVGDINAQNPMAIGSQLFYIKKVPSVNARNASSSKTTEIAATELSPTISNVKVYPNPVTGSMLNVEAYFSNVSAETDVILCNVQGLELFHKKYNTSTQKTFSMQIDISHLSIGNGIYFLKLRNNKEEIVKVISIQR